jgi:hypothetical protein
MSLFEIISLILSGGTIVAIGFAIWQIRINRKQLYVSTITKCINDYRAFGRLKQDERDFSTVSKYVDLVNEELFYIQFNYIPKEVAKEWIDGMLDFMPLINGKDEIVNKKYCLTYLVDTHVQIYSMNPRVANAFTIRGEYNIPLINSMDLTDRKNRIQHRNLLINEVYGNIKRFEIFK